MHHEAITSKAEKIFDNLKNFPEFYLAGGTALALQLGHRISVDFDFFCRRDIPKGLLQKVRSVFAGHKIEVVINHPEQLMIAISGVSLTFVKYPFPVISRYIRYQGINILPAREIAAMKAYALGRRATLKDYVDLYFVVKKKIATPEAIIELAKEKYGQEFNIRLFLEQLVYVEDVEDIEIKFLKEKVAKFEIEKFFIAEVKKIKFK